MFTRKLTIIGLAALLSVSVLTLFAGRAFAHRVAAGHVADFWEPLDGKTVACKLCPRQCVIANNARGFCRARENRNGTLYTLNYGLPCSIQPDPIEKAPFYHFLPGTNRLGIATAGCNQTCKYCQNWQISQARVDDLQNANVSPDSMVAIAKSLNLPTVCFTYTEPTVFYEYMYDIATRAREAGLKSVVVSSGYMNEEPMRKLCQAVDAVKIDLKGFDEHFYENVCSGTLAPVLSSLKTVQDCGVHLEIVNLVVPTLNDSMNEIRAMCRWIMENLGPDVPLHFSRFVPNYKLMDLPMTPVATLEQAISIAHDEGLHYVYIGNVPGHAQDNTYCPKCGKVLIQRLGYDVVENNIADGRCKYCGEPIPGVWQ